jgi:hypothetical protein
MGRGIGYLVFFVGSVYKNLPNISSKNPGQSKKKLDSTPHFKLII